MYTHAHTHRHPNIPSPVVDVRASASQCTLPLEKLSASSGPYILPFSLSETVRHDDITKLACCHSNSVTLPAVVCTLSLRLALHCNYIQVIQGREKHFFTYPHTHTRTHTHTHTEGSPSGSPCPSPTPYQRTHPPVFSALSSPPISISSSMSFGKADRIITAERHPKDRVKK